MKKYIVTLILFLIPVIFCAQNAVTLYRSLINLESATICRTITVPKVLAVEAINVGDMQSLNKYNLESIDCELQLSIERALSLHSIKSPETIYGPFKYVRGISTIARNQDFVDERYIEFWKKINETTGYNGIHHLINRATIKKLHADLKAQGNNVSLMEMETNAPSIFHPLHGNPEYQEIFHNADKQYDDYQKYGMKFTILRLLARINFLNIGAGLKPMPAWYIKGILTEAELWTKYYGLIWEK